MDLKDIIECRTVIDNNHESLYRAYHVLYKVLAMVERGDSKQTINEVATFLMEHVNESHKAEIKKYNT